MDTLQLNVNPVPTLDEQTNVIRMRTAEIINEYVLPYERELWQGSGHGGEQPDKVAAERRDDVRRRVKEGGLWAPHLPAEYGGAWA
jgi:acyl-CoA dehydrogenase